VDAVEQVALDIMFPDSLDRSEPDEQVLADALLVTEAARQELARKVASEELRILEALLAKGWDWARIGVHLGYPDAATNAKDRYDRLLSMWPSHVPAVSGEVPVQ
jgi:hypothetical protein